MSVTVTRNFPPLDQTKFTTRDDWARIGRLVRERIITRTTRGLDESDTPFAPYSAAYGAEKRKHFSSPRVDLQLSGEMLRNIVIEPDESGVTLTFA